MTFFRTFVFIFVFPILIHGCDYVAQNVPLQSHESHGVNLQYPVYWEFVEERINESVELISIDGPLGSSVIMSFVPINGAISLEEYAQIFSKSFRESAKILSITETSFEPVKETIGNHNLTGIREVYAAYPMGIEVPMRRNYYMIKREEDAIYLVIQDDEELEFEGKLIEKIKASLVFQ